MDIKRGNGATKYGPGVAIELTGDEVATAIAAYLVAHNIHVDGPRTISVDGQLLKRHRVFVDPSGFVIANRVKFDGRGEQPTRPEGE